MGYVIRTGDWYILGHAGDHHGQDRGQARSCSKLLLIKIENDPTSRSSNTRGIFEKVHVHEDYNAKEKKKGLQLGLFYFIFYSKTR